MTYTAPDDWTASAGIKLEGTALEVVKSMKSLSVLAGPGAGKTEILAQRANFLLTTGLCPPPRRIHAIAFKVDAARNLLERVQARCDPIFWPRFESLTLHSFAKRILDQFREALPDDERPTANYRIFAPNAAIWNDFRRSVEAEIPAVSGYNNEDLNIVAHSEPFGGLFPDSDGRERIRKAWWEFCIKSSQSSITFDMVLLLATRILKKQQVVQSALRRTYSHVFLDEFQDVNDFQYRLIMAAFSGGDAVLTAVGDTNQAIMKYAGALPDVFQRLETDFSAAPRRLLFNFRSNTAIVGLINSVVTLFESNPVPTEAARRNDPVPSDATEGWIFATRRDESAAIADFIGSEIQSGRRPEDFVVLARLHIGNVEDRLRPHFIAKGIKIRNESRKFREIEIQDLLKEPAVRLIMATLKLAVNARIGSPFQVCRDFVAELEGWDIASERGLAGSIRATRLLVDELAFVLSGRTAADVTGKSIAEAVITDDRKTQLSRLYGDYRNKDRLGAVLAAFGEFYETCALKGETWEQCVDAIEGRGAVRLMTIHKSKGLEYHTVFFVELNDDAFWNNQDDANVFLVALSRARERVKFSFSEDSSGFKNVQQLIASLQKAGVTFIRKTGTQ
ncbi:UvrD-helicase domain-containing protein [Rhizobium ruizarguesonis]|uniref:UvrD-helicase domain-containing protein n=1 Tax=Rhizobium ruizarguesonis TaxID=2081791 RepID=UPI0010312FCC|nr:ATP-dependent helicase [Rhizobium ruizarguesonis]TBA06368.1 ATP-dependent helicase [Rhizobium ruizarguesonis]